MRVRRSTRALRALLVCLAFGSAIGVPRAAALGCSNISASAIDQYCEMTPTATGGRVPGSGQPSLGASLAAPERRLLAGSRIGRRLARLPAAHRISRIAIYSVGGQPVTSGAGVSPLSLGWPLILLLAVVGTGLVGAAAFSRWQHRQGGRGGASG